MGEQDGVAEAAGGAAGVDVWCVRIELGADHQDRVLETLLNLILSEKAGINLQESTGSSKPMEDFIRQFTGSGSAGNGDPLKRDTPAAAEKTASR